MASTGHCARSILGSLARRLGGTGVVVLAGTRGTPGGLLLRKGQWRKGQEEKDQSKEIRRIMHFSDRYPPSGVLQESPSALHQTLFLPNTTV